MPGPTDRDEQAGAPMSASPGDVAGAQWLGHPRGLSTLFFTEMWERLSYYGMRALLILFMTETLTGGGLGLTDARAGAIYGLYTAAVYLVSLPGGWIADRLLGQRRAVFWGGVIIALGHFSMAIPDEITFYLGLVLISMGTGLLKPNVSAQVGELYPADAGARRDAGFSVYYMGINIGAFAGPLICGYLGENVDWHLGFSAAGIGMIFGVIQYRLGGKHLLGAGELRATAAEQLQARRQLFLGLLVLALAVAGFAFVHGTGILTLSPEGFAAGAGIFIGALAVVYFASLLLFGGLGALDRNRVVVIFIFFLSAALFWAGFEQAGSSMNLFAERLTNRVAFGFEVPTSWLQSVNALFIILLAPVIGALWIRLGARNPSIPVKFAMGLVLLGSGFFVLAWGSTFTTGDRLVSPMWLVVTYFLHTVGELCLSPVGLSSITKLAPRHLVGQMMGTWFMGSALGNLIAGQAAGFIESMPLPRLFGTVALASAGAGLLLFIFSKPIRRMIGPVR
jgi:POT family proton-dependent oligopeptide transporter